MRAAQRAGAGCTSRSDPARAIDGAPPQHRAAALGRDAHAGGRVGGGAAQAPRCLRQPAASTVSEQALRGTGGHTAVEPAAPARRLPTAARTGGRARLNTVPPPSLTLLRASESGSGGAVKLLARSRLPECQPAGLQRASAAQRTQQPATNRNIHSSRRAPHPAQRTQSRLRNRCSVAPRSAGWSANASRCGVNSCGGGTRAGRWLVLGDDAGAASCRCTCRWRAGSCPPPLLAPWGSAGASTGSPRQSQGPPAPARRPAPGRAGIGPPAGPHR